MALDVRTLMSSLSALFDSPPATFDGCASAWANAMADYSSLLVPPVASTDPAKAVLEVSLTTIFAVGGLSGGVTTTSSMETAFRQFAIALGAAMLPPFTSTPVQAPPGDIGFSSLVGTPQATSDAAAIVFGSLIHSWMLTGTATNTTTLTTVSWT